MNFVKQFVLINLFLQIIVSPAISQESVSQARTLRVVMSDSHLDPAFLLDGAQGGHNERNFQIWLSRLPEIIDEARANGSATDVALVFNGDPFDRDAWGRLGDPAQGGSPERQRRAIAEFAQRIRGSLASATIPVQFFVNSGDHEIRKAVDQQTGETLRSPNGDNVLRLEEDTRLLRQAWEGAGFEVVGENPSETVRITFADGSEGLFRHYQYASDFGFDPLLESRYNQHGEYFERDGERVYFNPSTARYPNGSGDLGYSNEARNLTIYTSDTHYASRNLVASVSPEVRTRLQAFYPMGEEINTGTMAARSRSPLTPVTIVTHLPGESARIFALEGTDGSHLELPTKDLLEPASPTSQVYDWDPNNPDGQGSANSSRIIQEVEAAAGHSDAELLRVLRSNGFVPADPIEHIRLILPCRD